ncbi:DsbA family protein [Gemmobacter serpentinus]|uniref:DsbA family protein n=1 Tax=Gemmobacter serpentinus TaxID=2652247 RepID=UPI001CF63916|nr:DsbA family protein [Gemmobacter serpentinus]
MIKLTRRDVVTLAGGAAFLAAMGLPAFAEGEAAATTDAPAADAPATADAAPVEVPDLVLGNPDAKVTLTEYASYTCPHCANFHDAVFKPLKAEYIDTGKVKFVFREVYFDRYGLWASLVARCGGDMRYFGLSSILFEKQREWAASEDPMVVVENLKTIGRTAGLSNEQLDACMQDEKMVEAMIAKFQKDMEADEVQGTPTLFLNGTKHSNMAYADLKALIDAELAK